jgi:hypothetical protein
MNANNPRGIHFEESTPGQHGDTTDFKESLIIGGGHDSTLPLHNHTNDSSL